MLTIIGLGLAYLAVGSLFGRLNRQVSNNWKGGEKPKTIEYLLFPVNVIERNNLPSSIMCDIKNDRYAVALYSLVWPLKPAWSLIVLTVWVVFPALTWHFSETVLGLSANVTSIPRRLRERKLRRLEAARKVIEEYAKAAGIEGEHATAGQVADVERKLIALRAAESDLVELKQKLESRSEASEEVAKLTSS